MSRSPRRGRHYPQPGPPPQGRYGPPPSYQGSQWQQGPAGGQWQSSPQQNWQQDYGYHGAPDVSEAASLPLAPIHRRAAARVLDNGLVSAFGFALVVPVVIGTIGLGSAGSKTETEGGIWNWPILFTLFAVLSVLPFIYEAVQLSLWGRTLGKRVMHLGVVQVRPAGDAITTTQAVWRAGIVHVGYQIGVFFFLALAVMVWDYLAYGMMLVWIGALMAYLWAIWDQPLRQSLHDRFSGTLVIDEREGYDEGGYGQGAYGETTEYRYGE